MPSTFAKETSKTLCRVSVNQIIHFLKQASKHAMDKQEAAIMMNTAQGLETILAWGYEADARK